MAYNKRDIQGVRYGVPISQRLFREHRVIPAGTSIVDHVPNSSNGLQLWRKRFQVKCMLLKKKHISTKG